MLLYTEIEEVSSRPSNITGGDAGWGFTMWSSEIDDDAPHRSLLERFAALHPEADIELPAFESLEDYIEATASWENGTVSIYYETVLSYLWLWSADRDTLLSFRAALLPLAA